MRKIWISTLLIVSINHYFFAQEKLIPIIPRVNIQSDSAKTSQIIDDKWVAVGVENKYAIQLDYSIPFHSKPSYRFELKESDNTLEGYSQDETKGRAELSYCYATHNDFQKLDNTAYEIAQKKKTVYHYGKGYASQASSRYYEFSIFVPSTLSQDVNTIFAQWHGMPDRTLVQTPEGIVKKLTDREFLSLYENCIIKKNIVYNKIPLYKDGKKQYKKNGSENYVAGKPNGWLIEQGGYPPLAFGFANNWFYIKANSDRKWLSDKTDRCNANPAKEEIMKPVKSDYKTSTIAYKQPFNDFPKNKWVTFKVQVQWTHYGGEKETIISPGKLDVVMSYWDNDSKNETHIVKNEEILIGRNDEDGYYFKFGIYRVGNSKIPVKYHLAGYMETNIQ